MVEGQPERPLAFPWHAVEELVRQPGEQAAEIAEGRLGEGQDSRHLARVAHDRSRRLLRLEGAIEAVAHLSLGASPAPLPLRVGHICEDAEVVDHRWYTCTACFIAPWAVRLRSPSRRR